MENIPSFIQAAAPYVGTNGVTAAYLGYKTKGGVRTKELCVVFGVVEKKPLSALAVGEALPQSIGALNTDVVQTGVYRAAPALPREHTARVRPSPGGSSIGHYRITAGTLGCWVLKDGRPVILSNNHILANQNDAVIGDPILQPGPYDGGQNPQDRLATLSQFVRVVESSDNEVDAALAAPDDLTYVDYTIGGIGRLNGPVNLVLDDAVRKDGRTTELQSGQVTGIHAVVSVQYDRFVARFVNQLIITPGGFSAGGDSGSAVVDSQNRLGALLFAGGDSDTIASPIDRVIAALDIEIPNAGETPPPPPPPVPTPDPGLNWQGWLVAVGLLLIAVVIAWLLR